MGKRADLCQNIGNKGMTVAKSKSNKEQPQSTSSRDATIMDDIHAVLGDSGKEMTDEQKWYLEKMGMYEHKGVPKAPIRERPLFSQYQDLLNDRVHSVIYCYCPSCAYHFYRLLYKNCHIQKEGFLYGWMLLSILYREHKASNEPFDGWLSFLAEEFEKKRSKWLKYNWRAADFFMYLLTEDEKFSDSSSSVIRTRRKRGTRYVKIIVECYKRKMEILEWVKSPELETELWIPKRLELVTDMFHRLWSFTKRVHLYLEEQRSKGREMIRHGELYDHFSKERSYTLFPCLQFLEHEGEIRWDKKNKKIIYVGTRKNINKKYSPIYFFSIALKISNTEV